MWAMQSGLAVFARVCALLSLLCAAQRCPSKGVCVCVSELESSTYYSSSNTQHGDTHAKDVPTAQSSLLASAFTS